MDGLKRAALAIALVLPWVYGASSASAQVTTLPRGSADRAGVMDVLRATVRQRIGKPVIFVVKKLRVVGPWVFVEAVPRNPDGSRIDYRGTPYEEAVRDGAFEDMVQGLLRKGGGRFRLVTYAYGATDVAYVDWWRRYGAPRAVLPHSQ